MHLRKLKVGGGTQPCKSGGCPLSLFLIHYFAFHCLFSFVIAGVEDMGREKARMSFKNNITKHVWKDDHIASQWKTLIVSRDRLCLVIAAVRD